MKRVILWLVLLTGVLLFLVSCGSNAFKSLADKESDEACCYETTQNLDSGNWDAVLNSTCADSMQKGAAYFGKAGYDIKDVINRLSEAQDETDPLEIYMSSLTGITTDSTFTYLDNARDNYDDVQTGSANYKDAQFYISLVDSVKTLSLMKVVIDDNGDGLLSTGCDKNSNGIPDEADATSCALLTSASQSCLTGVSIISGGDISPLTILNKTGTYRGLIIRVTGTGTATSCPNTNNEYKRLLFQSGSQWITATTTSNMCQETSPTTSREWPCPIEQITGPLDLVTTIDTSIQNAIDSLGEAFPLGEGEDVQEAIQDIRDEACGGDTCTSSEIANYLQNYF
ncbi:MAG: hypothetical protein AB1478_11395 [Nitrospirota bacterium]